MKINLNQGTQAWLEYRREKFNASETPDIMGVGFNKPYQLAQIKFGGVEQYQSRAMADGIKYEPLIRQKIEIDTGLKFEPCVIQSDDDPRFSASLDGYNEKENLIIEIKFSKNEAFQIHEKGEPSINYYYQIQHQLMVTGAKKCLFVAGYIDNGFQLEYKSCEVLPEPKIWDKIQKAWIDFENDYKNEIIDAEFMDISTELSELNEKAKEIEAKIKELKDRALIKANGRECKVANITIYKTTRKGGYDYAKFIKDQKIEIPSGYKKADSDFWAVRINS